MLIARALIDELITHANEEAPNECCGVVAVEEGSPCQPARAVSVHPAVNTAASPLKFEVDGRELLGLLGAIESEGLELGAIYHSHTRTQPYPSQTDINFAANWPGVEWIIVDRFVMPPEQLPYSTEKPLYLDRCYQVSDRQREIAPLPTRATYGLPEDAFVFCSFNNNFKFTDAVFDSWMRIVRAVEGSVLWLLADNEWARENMLARAEKLGLTRDRLHFAPRVSPAEYLARFTLADLVLDTFPYNAGTTASDTLWMGTPIVTLSGRSYISRMAGSLLTHIGLPELVTESLADYERLAIRLGNQPQRIASYKRYLAEHGRSSPLFDVPAFVRELEIEFERLALAHRAS